MCVCVCVCFATLQILFGVLFVVLATILQAAKRPFVFVEGATVAVFDNETALGDWLLATCLGFIVLLVLWLVWFIRATCTTGAQPCCGSCGVCMCD